MPTGTRVSQDKPLLGLPSSGPLPSARLLLQTRCVTWANTSCSGFRVPCTGHGFQRGGMEWPPESAGARGQSPGSLSTGLRGTLGPNQTRVLCLMGDPCATPAPGRCLSSGSGCGANTSGWSHETALRGSSARPRSCVSTRCLPTWVRPSGWCLPGSSRAPQAQTKAAGTQSA